MDNYKNDTSLMKDQCKINESSEYSRERNKHDNKSFWFGNPFRLRQAPEPITATITDGAES